MTINGWIQILVFCGIIILLVKPLGGYITRVFNGDRTFLSPVFVPFERGLYRLAGTSEREEQHWTSYTAAMLLFNLAGFLLLYAMQRFQGALPFNPMGMSNVPADLAFNTATSFVTNTNWQNYGGESTMSYLTQMAGLTVQNFVSAATGVAIAMALIRAFSRKSMKTLGNFWVDLTRCTLYILLPICIVMTLAFVALGVPQTLGAYAQATTLEGARQVIALGPVASQLAIKMLGTNGGGFFNANSAHPFENPDAISNMIQMVAIFAIGASLTNVFGRMVGNEKQGWAIFAAMGVLFVAGVAICYWAEAAGNPLIHALGIDGANMEGKEARFGIAMSALFAVVTTAASCGAVIAMHDSMMALGGMIPMINMMLGEIIIGGVGAGFYGIILFVIVAIFVAGLMVGRTPEYLGKKIEAKEVKMAMLAVLCLPLSILGFTAIASVIPAGLSSIANQGPHGFSEILYAYTSGTANNGSAFGGLSGNTPWYNITIGLAMLMGRFLVIVPAMAIAGSLVARHLPDPWSFVRGLADRRHSGCRRADLLPRAGAGTDRRTPRLDPGKDLLMLKPSSCILSILAVMLILFLAIRLI
jgi:K+-transporting ATPase ATPase A chain